MKAFFSEIRGAIVSTLVLAVVCCGVYPVVVWGIAQVAFHDKANGSLITDPDGTVRGSTPARAELLRREILPPRPSAAGAKVTTPPAPAAATWATSDKLANGVHAKDDKGKDVDDTGNFDGIKDRVAAYRTANGLQGNGRSARRRRHRVRQRPRSAHQRAQRGTAGRRGSRRRATSAWKRSGNSSARTRTEPTSASSACRA